MVSILGINITNFMKARKNDVCLLYSESDKLIAEKLEYALNFYSIDVWKTQNIPIGNKIVSETTQVLKQAKVIIILWSSTSIKSALLKQLASEYKKEKKVLIPVLIENVQIPGEFIDIQPANLIGWNEDKDSKQVVKLWILIRDPVISLNRSRSFFNNVKAVGGLLLTLTSIAVAITTPEVRCFLKLEYPPKTTLSDGNSNIQTSLSPSSTLYFTL